MSEETPPADVPEPATRTGPRGPLNPRPGVLALAVLLTIGLFFNAWLDSQPGEYDGKYVTVMTAALIAGVLGFDLRRFWTGGGGEE